MREVRLAAGTPLLGMVVAAAAHRWTLAIVLVIVALLSAAIVASYGLLRASKSRQPIHRGAEPQALAQPDEPPPLAKPPTATQADGPSPS
jgi:hypothetical protein